MDPHALGALIAGDLAASREIARLTGAYEDYQLVLRQGQQCNTLIAEVSKSWALLIQVNTQVPLGWARMLTQETARRLAQVIQTPPEKPAESEKIIVTEDLTNTLSDSLDSMWTEEPDVR